MELKYTDEQIAFRDEVRSCLEAELPKALTTKVATGKRLKKEDYEFWHDLLFKLGWRAPNWPTEYGGAAWDVVQRHIYEEECARANAPRPVPFGINMLGPVLQKFGSKEQCDYYLPRMLNGEHWWCQGYSEPGAGSDLASLRTSAVRDGDHYIVNGQKTWTTLGQHADWIFCLVRTSTQGKPQEGISFLLIDMNSPGVEVRPIVLLDGEPEVNEVWFTDVRVPAENLVGEENKGWTYAKYLLTHERTNAAGVGFATEGFNSLVRIAREQKSGGKALIDNPFFASRLAKVEIDLMTLATTNLRVVAKAASGQAPGAESSILKIIGTELRQEINALTRQAAGPYAQPFVSELLDYGSNAEPVGPDFAMPATQAYFNNRKLTIYGGSNEVQRGIISKAILEL